MLLHGSAFQTYEVRTEDIRAVKELTILAESDEAGALPRHRR